MSVTCEEVKRTMIVMEDGESCISFGNEGSNVIIRNKDKVFIFKSLKELIESIDSCKTGYSDVHKIENILLDTAKELVRVGCRFQTFENMDLCKIIGAEKCEEIWKLAVKLAKEDY